MSRGQARLALGLVVAFFLAHVAYLSCVAEDAFISFRFARNLAAGYGLVWNVGEAPVEGYTNFLWVILCAVASWLGLNVPATSLALGAAAGVATLILLYRCGRRVCGFSRAASLAAPALAAASGPLAAWAGSGMETALFALLVTAGVTLCGSYLRRGDRTRLLASHLLLLLATLTRPEGLMVYGIVGALGLLLGPGTMASRVRDHAAPVLSYVAIFAIYFWWRLDRYGYPLPNTFYAKTVANVGQVVRGTKQTIAFAFQFLTPLLPLAVLALGLRERPWRWPSAVEVGSVLRRSPGLVLPLAIALPYTGYIAVVGGDYMAMHRFFVPLVPLLALVVAHMVAPLLERTRAGGPRAALTVALAIALGGTLIHSTPLEHGLLAPTPMAHGNHRGILVERWHVARLTRLGRFFDEYAGEREATVATKAIGAMAWVTERRVYGLHGLVDAAIAHADDQRLGTGRAGHERDGLLHVLTHQRPTFVMLKRQFSEAPEEFWHLISPEAQDEVRRAYVYRAVELTDEVNGETGYFNFLERTDWSAER